MSDEPMSRTAAAQTTKNLALTGRFLREALEDPAIFDAIPDGATLVMMPPDDPDLSAANLHLAEQISPTKNVHLYPVGQPRAEAEQWRSTQMRTIALRTMKPHWPETIAPEPGDLRIVYDRERDVLLVDFFGGRREARGLPYRQLIALRIDPANDEVVGYLLAGFLEVQAQRSPGLVTTLRIAEVREITEEAFGGLLPPKMPPAGGDRSEQEKADALAHELDTLTA